MSASEFLRSIQRYPPAEENKRRLARYDEAIRLLRLARDEYSLPGDTQQFIEAFLVAETKAGKG